MAKKKLSFEEIMKMAEQYGVADNVLFVSAADRYAGQMEIIRKIQEDLAGRGLLIESVGSQGQKKIEANPMAGQLPKYNDTANKTLSVMLDIIQKLGTQAPAGDKLGEFLDE
jgi:RecA/RadA recombinase